MSGTYFQLTGERAIQSGELWTMALTVGGTATIGVVKADIRKSDGSALASFRSDGVGAVGGTCDVNGRTITFALPSAVTKSYAAGPSHWDVWVTLDGEPRRILYGPVTVRGKGTAL